MPTNLELSEATSAQTWGARLALVPVGSLEQHGPHLPLDTDTAIAVAVAEGAARSVTEGLPDHDGVWVAPAIGYGSSGEHQSFPGTTSVGTDALRHTLIELTRSLRTWTPRVLFVNAHGGNLEALTSAVDQLLAEGHDVAWVPCRTEGVDLHAGRTETSLMLHLRPWSVRHSLVEVGDTRPLSQILPAMRRGGVAAVSANGVLGDPRDASAEEGREVLASMIDDVVLAARTLLQPQDSRP